VRSLTLDVRVWDAPVMALMAALGNAAANAVWEEALRRVSAQADSWVRRPRRAPSLRYTPTLNRPPPTGQLFIATPPLSSALAWKAP